MVTPFSSADPTFGRLRVAPGGGFRAALGDDNARFRRRWRGLRSAQGVRAAWALIDTDSAICDNRTVNAFEQAGRRDIFVVNEVEVSSGRPQARAEIVSKCVMTLALWGTSYVFYLLGGLLSHSATLATGAAVRAAMVGVGLLICYGFHRLLRRLAHRSFRTRAIVASILAPFVAETFAWASYFANAAAQGRTPHFVIENWADAVIVLMQWTWFFVAWTGLYLAIEYSFEARHEAERSAALRIAAQSAKLRALSNQINPHFLFNSLNSISALMLDGKTAEAESMLARLSDFFRSTLAIDPMVETTLAEELELHRRYLAIEQVRYPDLGIEIRLPETLRRARVPALIVQPLVENAIKHGVAKSAPPTSVVISAAEDHGMLAISVVDTGSAEVMRAPPEREGVGIANVRQRLTEYFGMRQSLTLAPGKGRFEALITMPLRFGV